MTDFEKLAQFRLDSGPHAEAKAGLCAMEAVAWLEGLPHSDEPECTCPVIANYVVALNDDTCRYMRQRLIRYLPKLVGTVDKAAEQERAAYIFETALPLCLNLGAYFAVKRIERAMQNGLCDGETWGDHAYAAAREIMSAWEVNEIDDAEPFSILDNLLAIGKKSPGFSNDVAERVSAYQEHLRARAPADAS